MKTYSSIHRESCQVKYTPLSASISELSVIVSKSE